MYYKNPQKNKTWKLHKCFIKSRMVPFVSLVAYACLRIIIIDKHPYVFNRDKNLLESTSSNDQNGITNIELNSLSSSVFACT